jgi:hypothetical protein
MEDVQFFRNFINGLENIYIPELTKYQIRTNQKNTKC